MPAAVVFPSATYTAQTGQADFNSRIDDARSIMGPVQFAFAKYTLAGTEDAAADSDYVQLINLPVGAIVIPELSKLRCSADPVQTALVIDIGDSADPDRYCDGLSIDGNTGADLDFVFAASIPDGVPNRYAMTASSNTVLVTFKTTTGTIATATIYFVIAYMTLGS